MPLGAAGVYDAGIRSVIRFSPLRSGLGLVASIGWSSSVSSAASSVAVSLEEAVSVGSAPSVVLVPAGTASVVESPPEPQAASVAMARQAASTPAALDRVIRVAMSSPFRRARADACGRQSDRRPRRC